MNDFLAFRRMITPLIIQVVFWIGVAVCGIGGIGSIVSGLNASYGGGAAVFSGLMMLLFGPLVVRIYCELIILFFRMNETLTDIKKNTESKSPQA